MTEDKKNLRGPVIGGASLIMVFAVLCFTVFALLSYSSAISDKKNTDKASLYIKNYYKS